MSGVVCTIVKHSNATALLCKQKKLLFCTMIHHMIMLIPIKALKTKHNNERQAPLGREREVKCLLPSRWSSPGRTRGRESRRRT